MSPFNAMTQPFSGLILTVLKLPFTFSSLKIHSKFFGAEDPAISSALILAIIGSPLVPPADLNYVFFAGSTPATNPPRITPPSGAKATVSAPDPSSKTVPFIFPSL